MDIPTATPEAREAIAPTGTLRAAINLSNALLVSGVEDGRPIGVSPDLASAVGEALGVPVQYVTYANPGELADAVVRDEWDIGNIGAEPQRAVDIRFTEAYAEIDCTYLVRPDSVIGSIAEVDRTGITVAVKGRAAYHLWIERNMRFAEVVTCPSLDAARDTFIRERIDVLAGLRPRLVEDAAALPGSRLLDGRFMSVQQAVGTPRSRNDAGADYLQQFVIAAKATGLVGRLIERHGVVGLSVAG